MTAWIGDHLVLSELSNVKSDEEDYSHICESVFTIFLGSFDPDTHRRWKLVFRLSHLYTFSSLREKIIIFRIVAKYGMPNRISSGITILRLSSQKLEATSWDQTSNILSTGRCPDKLHANSPNPHSLVWSLFGPGSLDYLRSVQRVPTDVEFATGELLLDFRKL